MPSTHLSSIHARAAFLATQFAAIARKSVVIAHRLEPSYACFFGVKARNTWTFDHPWCLKMKLHLRCRCRLGMRPIHQFQARAHCLGNQLSTCCCPGKRVKGSYTAPMASNRPLICATIDELLACFERNLPRQEPFMGITHDLLE